MRRSSEPAVDARGYQIVVQWSDEDRCYLARAPALDGCLSHGDTPEQAARNGVEAAELWLQEAVRHGDPIPKPAKLLSGKMTLRLPTSLHQRVAEAAVRDGVSVNQWIVTQVGRVA